MAKRNMKAIPVATEAPRPTEPPAEGELGRQALERARRFLKGRESLVAVYGEDWRELARRDLELVELFGLFDDRVRTRLYLQAYRDALLATSYPDQGLPPVRVSLDPPVDPPVEPPVEPLVGTGRKGFRPPPGRSVLDI